MPRAHHIPFPLYKLSTSVFTDVLEHFQLTDIISSLTVVSWCSVMNQFHSDLCHPLDSHSDHNLGVCSEASGCWWLCWCAAVLKRNRMMWELPWRLLFHCDSEDNHTLCNWTDLLTVCSCWPSHINFLPLCPQGTSNGSACAFYWYYVEHIWNCKGVISTRDSCTKTQHSPVVNFGAGHF